MVRRTHVCRTTLEWHMYRIDGERLNHCCLYSLVDYRFFCLSLPWFPFLFERKVFNYFVENDKTGGKKIPKKWIYIHTRTICKQITRYESRKPSKPKKKSWNNATIWKSQWVDYKPRKQKDPHQFWQATNLCVCMWRWRSLWWKNRWKQILTSGCLFTY